MMFEQFNLSFFIIPVTAFLLVVALVIPFRKLAHMFGIVDKPDNRKKHGKAIPPIGGLIVFISFMVIGLASGIVDLQKYWALYISLIILLVFGAIDDQIRMPARLKFLIHIFAAGFIAFMGNVQVAYMGDLFGLGTVWTGFMSYPFTIIAIVLLINAMNLMDGLDGLAGGVSSVIFFWFLLAAVFAGWIAYAQVLLLLIACIAGFLVFNMRNPWRRGASLFLGDAGSMSLGLAVAWFSVLLARGPETPIEPIAVAWIIGFPIFDTCAQFYRRVSVGRDPFSPDRGHFHHHFIDAGIGVRRASAIIIAIVAIMGAIGYGGIAIGVPPVILTIIWVALLFTHIIISSKPERYVRIIKYCSGFNTKKMALTSLLLPVMFLSSCVETTAFTKFFEQDIASNKAQGQVDNPVPKSKNIGAEKLLNEDGGWSIIEQGREMDPAKAHLIARERVNIARRKNKAELAANFKPDAPSGEDGKVRVLSIEASESNLPDKKVVASSTVVEPSKKVTAKNMIKKISSLFMVNDKAEDIIEPPIITPLKKPVQEVISSVEADVIDSDVIVPSKKPVRAGAKNSPSDVSKKSGKSASVIKMRSATHSDVIRVVIEVTDITKYKVTIDPLRNVLRLKMDNTSWDIGDQGNIKNSDLLGSYVVRKQKDGASLLEIRLKKKAKISDTVVLRPNSTSKHRIVIDLSLL